MALGGGSSLLTRNSALLLVCTWEGLREGMLKIRHLLNKEDPTLTRLQADR